jgi:tungstate transport system ATP-binding protein
MAEALFCLRDIRKTYGARDVLKVDTLDIFDGEILAFVGPSGAGKSTLLRLLNFLEIPSAGALAYRGDPYPDISLERRREITTVFQRPVLLNASVRANVGYGLDLRGINGAAAIDEMLGRVGLAGMERTPARKLSGGEMQRVALARALVIEPRVLLLDEPTANLDPYNVGLIEEIVRAQHRARGTTIVLVTHNLFQAKRLAERVGLMLNGQLVEIGSVSSFFESPQDPRTAAFVRGEMVY